MSASRGGVLANGFLEEHPVELCGALARDPTDARLRGALGDWHATHGDHDFGEFSEACRWAARQARAIKDSVAVGGWYAPGTAEVEQRLGVARDVLRRRLGGWLGRRGGNPASWRLTFDEACCGLKLSIHGRPHSGVDDYQDDGNEYDDVVASLCSVDGFFDSMHVNAAWLTRVGDKIGAIQPISRVTLQGVQPDLFYRALGDPSWGYGMGSAATPIWGGVGPNLYRRLYYALPDGPPGSSRRGLYSTRQDAFAALSWTLLRRCRPAECGELPWCDYRGWFSTQER